MNTKTYNQQIDESFKITLPPEFREEYNLHEGDTISVSIEANTLKVIPIETVKKDALKTLEEGLKKCDQVTGTEFDDLSEEETIERVNKIIKKVRAEKQAVQ